MNSERLSKRPQSPPFLGPGLVFFLLAICTGLTVLVHSQVEGGSRLLGLGAVVLLQLTLALFLLLGFAKTPFWMKALLACTTFFAFAVLVLPSLAIFTGLHF